MRVLFLCTGNACRSQIAEGWARHLKGDVMEVFSAGLIPGRVNERAIAVMAEAGVDISGHRSKHMDEFAAMDFDYVVTVCDHVHEVCPVFPRARRQVHKGFEDPSFMQAGEDEIMAAFRKLRDDMRKFIETMPDSLRKMSAQK